MILALTFSLLKITQAHFIQSLSQSWSSITLLSCFFLDTEREGETPTYTRMASCSMASAASGFVLTPNTPTNGNSSAKSNMVFFAKNNNPSRLVVRAAEEGAAPVATTTATAAAAEAPKAKPPPIGPKRGTKVSLAIHFFD